MVNTLSTCCQPTNRLTRSRCQLHRLVAAQSSKRFLWQDRPTTKRIDQKKHTTEGAMRDVTKCYRNMQKCHNLQVPSSSALEVAYANQIAMVEQPWICTGGGAFAQQKDAFLSPKAASPSCSCCTETGSLMSLVLTTYMCIHKITVDFRKQWTEMQQATFSIRLMPSTQCRVHQALKLLSIGIFWRNTCSWAPEPTRWVLELCT